MKPKDEYDGDENTVSQYDDMHQYKKFDFGHEWKCFSETMVEYFWFQFI